MALNVPWLAGGLLALLATGALSTAVLCWTRSGAAVAGASLAGALALALLWFRLTASGAHRSGWVTVRTTLILAVPVALAVWVVHWWWTDDRPGPTHWHRPTGVAYLLTAALVALGAAQFLSFAPDAEAVHHLRLMWTGLDAFELLGLLATGWCLHRGTPFVVVPASATAALLVADAWTNVVSSAGVARLAALGMAVVELSLAGLSLAVAAGWRAGAPDPWPSPTPASRPPRSSRWPGPGRPARR